MYIGISSSSEDDDDEDNAPLMILEYMPYGDLQSFLESHKYVATSPPWILYQYSVYSILM